MNSDFEASEYWLNRRNEFDGNLRFGAAEFHRKTNRTGVGRPASGALVAEHAKIVTDTGTNRFQRHGAFWEEVKECPICKSVQRNLFVHRMGLDVWRCIDCGHGYQDPRITYAKATELYANDKTASDIYTESSQIEIDRIKYRYGLDLIKKFCTRETSKILDFGCGAGVFLEEAQVYGWETCIGIDANSNYQSGYKTQTGIQYINSSFEALETSALGSGYQCITMWNVLEHLYNVENIVVNLRKIMAPKGVILIMVPNFQSLATRLIRDKSATFNWKHISHFTEKSLKMLFTKCGFRCLHMETAISEIDNIKSYLSGEEPYGGFGDPDGLFSFITPRYLHDNMLGSRLIGVFEID